MEDKYDLSQLNPKQKNVFIRSIKKVSSFSKTKKISLLSELRSQVKQIKSKKDRNLFMDLLGANGITFLF